MLEVLEQFALVQAKNDRQLRMHLIRPSLSFTEKSLIHFQDVRLPSKYERLNTDLTQTQQEVNTG